MAPGSPRASLRGRLSGTALIVGDVFLKHRPPIDHPESPSRIKSVIRELVGVFKTIRPRPAEPGEIMLVHEEEYVSLLRSYSELGMGGQLDPDTFVSMGTWESAIHAVGASIQASLLAASKAYSIVFAAVRPPGHHAYPGRAAGFCIFNNIAVAASKIIAEGMASRVAIVDIDAHYGDGTSHIFYSDPRILYISLHGDPRQYYPWRGFPEEMGAGEGRGFNIAVPLPPGIGDEEYVEVLRRIVIPVLEEYRPELILVSAGFDTHYRDPLMDFQLTVQGHWLAARLLYKASLRISGRGLAAVLEGGYDAAALPRSIANFLAAGGEEPLFSEPRPGKARKASRRLVEYMARARRVLSQYWAL